MHPYQPVLFVEGLKMRPTAERVLQALAALDGRPDIFQSGNTATEIAHQCGLTAHVVRARLQDLRRLGLVQSGQCLQSSHPTERQTWYAHHLTSEGERRFDHDDAPHVPF